MTKTKKTKVTPLDRIAARLRTALRGETKNIIEIGNLLIESRKHLDHGEWQPWVAENSGLSIRTAQNYLNAAEYVRSKSATVADFITNLSPTVLYEMAAGHYDEQWEAAILAAAREGRVDEDAADAIGEKLAPADNDADSQEDESPPTDTDNDSDSNSDSDSEIEAILDGPPPAVPPSAPNLPPTDFALRDFEQALSALNRLKTKPSTQFIQTAHGADDLESVEAFIRAVRTTKFPSPPESEAPNDAVAAPISTGIAPESEEKPITATSATNNSDLINWRDFGRHNIMMYEKGWVEWKAPDPKIYRTWKNLKARAEGKRAS
jgi:hypothetical protein